MIYYIVFTYFFFLGATLKNDKIPVWNLIFAPLVFPVIIGKWLANNYNK